jgi:hypothetical protein
MYTNDAIKYFPSDELAKLFVNIIFDKFYPNEEVLLHIQCLDEKKVGNWGEIAKKVFGKLKIFCDKFFK